MKLVLLVLIASLASIKCETDEGECVVTRRMQFLFTFALLIGRFLPQSWLRQHNEGVL